MASAAFRKVPFVGSIDCLTLKIGGGQNAEQIRRNWTARPLHLDVSLYT
jgi:hypothetical protein